MRGALGFTIGVFAVVLLSGCADATGAGAPATPPAALTAAPAATQAPGSTEAAPASEQGTLVPAQAVEATVTEAPSPPESEAAGTPAPVNPAVPKPTMSAAPTEAPAATVAPTAAAPLACTPGALTPAQTEGPYYSANPPEASALLERGMSGTQITITGYVLDAQCQPLPGARVDFWQADAGGQYDNQGYTLRGYQVTDAEGRYRLETVIPGLYPGRTRHIHVKVTPPSGPTLTTQLYFPDEAANDADRIFSPELVVELTESAGAATGVFNFVTRGP